MIDNKPGGGGVRQISVSTTKPKLVLLFERTLCLKSFKTYQLYCSELVFSIQFLRLCLVRHYFWLNISCWAKLISLLLLVALRESVRSQAKIVAVVRKTFGKTTKLSLGVGRVIFSLVKSILTGVPQGKTDRSCAHRGDHNIHMSRVRTISLDEAARSPASPLCALALKLLKKMLKPPS